MFGHSFAFPSWDFRMRIQPLLTLLALILLTLAVALLVLTHAHPQALHLFASTHGRAFLAGLAMAVAPAPAKPAAKPTIMDKVKAITADIEALPAEYRSLVTKVGAWETTHVVLAMLGAGVFGYFLHMILRFPV